MNLSCDTRKEGIDCQEPVSVDHDDGGEAGRYVVMLGVQEKRQDIGLGSRNYQLKGLDWNIVFPRHNLGRTCSVTTVGSLCNIQPRFDYLREKTLHETSTHNLTGEFLPK
jgi:hypothetical protein